MLKLVLFCILDAVLVLRPCLVLAQYRYLSPTVVEVSLQAETLPLTAPTVYVERVLDARVDQTSIGSVLRGSGLRLVQLKQGAVPELQSFLRSHLSTRTNRRPILLRLVALQTVEFSTKVFATNTAAELTAEYYAYQPDSTCTLLCRVYANTHRAGPDPDQQHASNVADLLRRSLEQVERVDWATQLTAGPAYSLAQLRRPAPVQPLAIQGTVPLLSGVYKSLLEFRQNAPSQPGNVTVDARTYHNTTWQELRAVSPFLLTPEGKRVTIEDAWGFCDGQQVYIRQGKEDYYLLERRGPIFMFFAPGYGQNSGLINGGPPKAPFSLDLQTGLVSNYTGVASGPANALANRPTHLMVYRRREKDAAPLPVHLNGATVGQLNQGDYVSLPWQDNGQPVRLCVGNGPCLELTPNFTEANYIEYQPGTTASLRTVPVREGAAQVSRMVGR